MSAFKLLKSHIDVLEPRATRYARFFEDQPNLAIRVYPSGKKVYALKYWTGRTQRWMTIGEHGVLTPDQAGRQARKLLGEIAVGGDPAAKRNAQRETLSFEEVVDRYFAEGVAHKKVSTLRVDRRRAELHLKPLLGRKLVDEIGRADIERMQADVIAGKTAARRPQKRRPGGAATGGAGVGAQCVALASTVLQFAVNRKLRPDNPARGIKKRPVRKMNRFLSAAEFTALADALRKEADAGGNPHAIAAIRLLALTGCRRSEIMTLNWSDVDLSRGLLTLRDSKTREKVVLLNIAAQDILREVPRIAENEFVVAGTKPKAAFVGIDKLWSKVRLAAGLSDVRLHDLRHSFASVGAELSLGLPIIGKLLGHTQAATTLRYAHLKDDPLRRAVETIGEKIAGAMGTEKSTVPPK